jgi:hypothetical protein
MTYYIIHEGKPKCFDTPAEIERYCCIKNIQHTGIYEKIGVLGRTREYYMDFYKV